MRNAQGVRRSLGEEETSHKPSPNQKNHRVKQEERVLPREKAYHFDEPMPRRGDPAHPLRYTPPVAVYTGPLLQARMVSTPKSSPPAVQSTLPAPPNFSPIYHRL